jgi:hypothetical protein
VLKIYIETTIPSYLAALPSRDLITAAHQQVTHDWWRTAKDRFELYTSEIVMVEIRAGDPVTRSRRLQLTADLPILKQTPDVQTLAKHYRETLGLSGKAKADIPHFAFAVSYEMDYLVTWNCSHIANGGVIRRLMKINDRLKRSTPLIVTPEEILESPEDME